MGDKQQSTTFPTPPPFYRYFTNANLQKAQQQKQSQSIEVSETPAVAHAQPDLRYLTPPEPPIDGRWKTFGFQHDLNAPNPSLDEAGIETLYPDHPSVKLAPQAYLIALARSLLATFLSTCGILAQNPTLYEEKIKNLRDMVFNMHDLINQYRPHQARESLLLMMEERVDQLRQEIKTIGELKDKLQQSFVEVRRISDDSQPLREQALHTNAKTVSTNARRPEQEAAWKLLEGLADEAKPTHEEPADITLPDAGTTPVKAADEEPLDEDLPLAEGD